MTSGRAGYVARFMRVIEYIDSHLTQALPLETLAAVANLSPFHFHRLFTAMTGETLADCIRRRRLESAATLLLNHPRRKVLEVAIQTGFGSTEVFARNFRKHFGCSASEWRRGAWRKTSTLRMEQLQGSQQQMRKKRHAFPLLSSDHALMSAAQPLTVTLRNSPPQRVAYLRHVGPYGPTIGATWERLWSWCRHHKLPHGGLAFGLVLDNPHVTEPAKCRYDACVAVDNGFRAHDSLGVQTIPGGRYGCLDFHGTSDELMGAWNCLYGEWLPDSGLELGEGRLMEIFNVDEPVTEAGMFRCQLCLPVTSPRNP
jgi:AraC family transcriptional regulator